MKPTIVVNFKDYTSFDLLWVKPIVSQWFNIELYDPSKNYHPATHAIMITYQVSETPGWYTKFEQQNFKIIVEHLWDSNVTNQTHVNNNRITLYCPNWMWYLAGWEFDYHGYKSYKPNRTRDRSFFMPMNNSRWHRDLALEKLKPLLDTAWYSYNCQGIHLPGDRKKEEITVPWQRYLNPDWYDRTAFSVVAESYMRTLTAGTEVSEKIFKPLAYYHPFITFGSQHTLKYLHEQGFETFPELFDETYDSIADDYQRHDAVQKSVWSAVERWQRNELEISSETAQKLQHNHQRVFDRDLTINKFYNEVVVDILEFLS
jgi:hypothetical protein